ncbi:MAG: FecR domain-containing protein, partial [Rhodospirillales bacterium]|nr:FecR domain-containing protein [Rhodospirillales bacterium]
MSMQNGSKIGDGSGANARTQIVEAQAGMPVRIPSEALLVGSQYLRSGPDLLLVGEDGDQVLVRDYFASDITPDLVTDNGARIGGDLALKLAGVLAPGQYAQAGRGAGAAAGQPIGNVETVTGQVQVTHADGSKETLSKGAPVYQGDVLQTPQGGGVGILFIDKTSLSLGASGRMVLDQMVFDPGTLSGKSAFSLVQGTFSFVSGQISKTATDAMVIKTPVATIGIRGTLGTGGYFPQTGLTAAIMPEGGQTTGEMSISNAGGTQVINQPNTGIQVGSFFSAPTAPVVVPAAF